MIYLEQNFQKFHYNLKARNLHLFSCSVVRSPATHSSFLQILNLLNQSWLNFKLRHRYLPDVTKLSLFTSWKIFWQISHVSYLTSYSMCAGCMLCLHHLNYCWTSLIFSKLTPAYSQASDPCCQRLFNRMVACKESSLIYWLTWCGTYVI